MARPTLTFGVTTLTLPYPRTVPATVGVSEIVQVALGGNTRIQHRWRKRRWTLNFVRKNKSTYDTVATLWQNAKDASSFVTFSFTEVFPEANAVSVRVELSDFAPFPPQPTIGDFTITLEMSGIV